MAGAPGARPLAWLASYRREWLGADVVAGLTLAAYAIPVSLAYATLAGLPPETGIYGYMLGGLGYALFGSSRQLAVGPTSAISLMVGVAIAPMAAGDPTRLLDVASLAALMVGLLAVVAWALKLSTLTSFISDTILLGFKAGAGISIAVTQLPAALGVPGGGDHFVQRVVTVAAQSATANPLVLAVSAVALLLLVAGDRLLPGRPVALAVVALAIVASATLDLPALGVATVGLVPSTLPPVSVPGVLPRDVDGIVPLAAACLLLAYIEGVSAARTLARRHGDRVDARGELLALGAANVLAGLFHGYPVAGGLSQSAVNDKAGARSPMALVVASAGLALALTFLTGFVQDLPRAVLAAVVLFAVSGLVDLRGIAGLRRLSRLEFRVAMTALVGVLLFGILRGVLLAAVGSILLLLHRTAFPHVAVLGRIPGTRRFSDLERHPDNETVAGVLLLRVEASLLYFNIEHVLKEVVEALEARPSTRLVVLDLSTSPYVDLAGAGALGRLADELEARSVAIRVVEAHAAVRDLLRASGVDARLGGVQRWNSAADLLDAFARGEIAPGVAQGAA